MATVDVNGTELHHERRGSGEPLLLVQGMSGNSLHWGERFLSELERDFELILYDHRGIGRSGPLTDPFTLGDLAEDAVGLLDALGIERAHVLGISMGGMVAQEIVLRHPGRVRTLALGCTYCGGPDARLTDEGVIQMLGDAMLSGDRQRAIRTGWEVNVSPGYAADHSNYAVFVEVAEAFPAPVPVIMAQMQAIAGHDTSARLGEVRAPTLVVHGTADQMLSSANGELIARLIPGARLELLQDVGHLFFWEEPQRSAALVRAHALAGRADARG
jgi:pimeloyl-ACP methyl ester carboxylesterase